MSPKIVLQAGSVFRFSTIAGAPYQTRRGVVTNTYPTGTCHLEQERRTLSLPKGTESASKDPEDVCFANADLGNSTQRLSLGTASGAQFSASSSYRGFNFSINAIFFSPCSV